PADLLVLPGVPGRRGAIVTGLVPGSGRAGLARAAFDGGACAALDVLDRSVTAGATWDDDEPLRLAAPATTRAVHAQTLADLSGRPVQPAPEASLAAAGACIQAAAVLDGADPAQVAEAWSLDGDEWFEPDALADRYERRAAHTAEQ